MILLMPNCALWSQLCFSCVSEDFCGDWNIGDINQDESYNVLDAILAVNLVLSPGIPSECEFYSADENEDGTLNILDVIGIINLVLDR